MNAAWRTRLVGTLLVLAVGAFLAVRTYRQQANARVFAIQSAGGIDESRLPKTPRCTGAWHSISRSTRSRPMLCTS